MRGRIVFKLPSGQASCISARLPVSPCLSLKRKGERPLKRKAPMHYQCMGAQNLDFPAALASAQKVHAGRSFVKRTGTKSMRKAAVTAWNDIYRWVLTQQRLLGCSSVGSCARTCLGSTSSFGRLAPVTSSTTMRAELDLFSRRPSAQGTNTRWTRPKQASGLSRPTTATRSSANRRCISSSTALADASSK
jgi:hypothetical protein